MKCGQTSLLLAWILMLGGLFACGSLPMQSRSTFELRSTPSGAEVVTLGGDHLGVTPLILGEEQITRFSANRTLNLRLEAPGCMPGTFFLPLHGQDMYEVTLMKYDSDFFTKRLIRDFARPSNEMIRAILRIQALIIGKKLDEAQRLIDSFQKTYPNVAASYAMLANIELVKGNTKKVREYLEMAYTLDPNDVMIARALGRGVKP